MSSFDAVAKKEEPQVSRAQRHYIVERYNAPYASLSEALTAARKDSLRSYDMGTYIVYQSVKSVKATVRDGSTHIETEVQDLS